MFSNGAFTIRGDFVQIPRGFCEHVFFAMQKTNGDNGFMSALFTVAVRGLFWIGLCDRRDRRDTRPRLLRV